MLLKEAEEMSMLDELNRRFQRDSSGIFVCEPESGYWSNLSREENKQLIGALKYLTTREAVLKQHPQLEDIIYSPMRGAGLEFLGLKGDEICIDYGCMWGALTIPLARRTTFVLGIDQTMDSLSFLAARAKEEGLSNSGLLCADLKNIPVFENKPDIAIANGVLEWIPDDGRIELKAYYGRYSRKEGGDINPMAKQKGFLKSVFQNLKEGGRFYLGIENRYDFKMFLGAPDPHANLSFTSILPRKIASLISRLRLGRPYVNWLYSFRGVDELLKQAGFSKVGLYMCFPDYRFPERIIPFENSLEDFEPTISIKNAKNRRTLKRFLARAAEIFVFKILRAKWAAPSIIAIAYK